VILGWVARLLAGEQVRFAMIGAVAMAAHGVSRSTLDIDLLTTDARVLDQTLWHAAQGASIDIRRGDADDPLLGVVRVRRDDERQVDVIVGRHDWQTAIVDGARPVDIEGESIPVADAAGLILLKLYAGGSQDVWDIRELLAAGDASALARSVDARITPLPPRALDLWRQLRPGS
jgi:hypothetical protein